MTSNINSVPATLICPVLLVAVEKCGVDKPNVKIRKENKQGMDKYTSMTMRTLPLEFVLFVVFVTPS